MFPEDDALAPAKETRYERLKRLGQHFHPDYEEARHRGVNLGEIDRWENGLPHHPMSERLMDFIADHDFADYDDYFCWKQGGDGDNGETLMYEMDAFFEFLDLQRQDSSPEKSYDDCPQGTYEEYGIPEAEE
jgi:hypothetical protein